jgi:dienelactone hydrolase
MGRRRTSKLRRIAPLFLFLFSISPSAAQDYIREEIRIPMPLAGPKGLQALFVRPNLPGRYPLIVLNHGSPRQPAERQKASPYGALAQAFEFARRGWAVAIVMRRGYGDSGGVYAESFPCDNADYFTVGLNSAADIRAAIVHLIKRDDVDPQRVVSIGQSAGGFASIALSFDAPAGLVAVINFAGGRGSRSNDQVCAADRLISAFAAFGMKSRVPTLWIYAENDRFFSPALSKRFYEVFTNAGGNAEFIRHPPFGEDGHRVFSRGIALWTPYVDAFFQKHNLTPRTDLLPLPVSDIQPPSNLSEKGLIEFKRFLSAAPNKAFAASPQGHFAWRSGRNTGADAGKDALAACLKYGPNCKVYAVNDELLR